MSRTASKTIQDEDDDELKTRFVNAATHTDGNKFYAPVKDVTTTPRDTIKISVELPSEKTHTEEMPFPEPMTADKKWVRICQQADVDPAIGPDLATHSIRLPVTTTPTDSFTIHAPPSKPAQIKQRVKTYTPTIIRFTALAFFPVLYIISVAHQFWNTPREEFDDDKLLTALIAGVYQYFFLLFILILLS